MTASPAFSLILPCYNEKPSLPILLEKYRVMNETTPFQLVLVNNGSTDGSDEVIARELGTGKFPFVTLVNVNPNQGYGWGIMQGARHATASVVGFTHSDLQCDPSDVKEAYELWKKHGGRGKLIKGRRIDRRPDERWISAKLDQLASLVLIRKLEDINGQPKLFSRDFLEELDRFPKDITFDTYLMGLAALRRFQVFEVPVHFHKRTFGVSSWNRGLLKRWKTILSFMRTILYVRMRIYR